jgi:sarcosine oxidase
LSESLGATIVRDERVVEYKPTASDNGVVVRSERRVYYGEQVVLSVGAWVQDLLTHSSRYFTVTRQVLLWFSPEQRSHSFETPYFPAFVWAFGSGPVNGIYGFPALNGHAGGVKVSTSDYGPLVDPEKPRGAVTQEEISQVYENGIRDRIEGLSPRCVRSAVCVYTVTPNSDFVVQRHPGCERIVIASPCSGHGFKHSAALGEAIAQVIATGNSTLDLSPFRTTYLSVKSP